MSGALGCLPEALVFLARLTGWLDAAQQNGQFCGMSTRSLRKSPLLRLVGQTTSCPDRQVQSAIESLHEQLDRRWTVTALARSVGVSRPVLARRFVEQTGLSPMRYLAQKRMERAAELLRDSDAALAQIGALVGYDSEFAFNRAFKRHHQLAPGSFRRRSAVSKRALGRASEEQTATVFRAAA
jgi:transcriptional regulator GlxA family with amidase domain